MRWVHLGDTQPVARKRHQCYLCCEMIEPGERYVLRAGITEGHHNSTRMHAECEAETRDWTAFDWESFSSGELRRPAAMEPRP